MKTCPVCKTAVFDDMDRCFGCMHRFELGLDPVDALETERGVTVGDAPVESWVMRIELREPEGNRSWSFELSR